MDGVNFGPYRLLGLLGRGGMGEVYRAYDTTTDRVVALKLLPEHLAGDASFQRRFAREAHIAAALTEPHIVPIHRYGDVDGRFYVDMRLIDGIDLHHVIRQGPMPPARVAFIIEQVAAALQAAHRAGLVHRDVKPANILLAEHDFAYLIDFGVACIRDETGLTRTGHTVGSLAYMSPERLQDQEFDGRADVYALTCVVYECLTGRKVFDGGAAEQIAAHLFNPPPLPSQWGCPPAFDQVIATGMAKDPATRFQSVGDLARAVRAAAVPEMSVAPTMPRPVQPAIPVPAPSFAPIQPRQPRARYRGRIVAGVLVMAVMLVAATVFAVTRHTGSSVDVAENDSVPTVHPVEIDELLLGSDELNSIFGRKDMVIGSMSDTLLSLSPATFYEPAKCRSVVAAGTPLTYQNPDQVRTMYVEGVPSAGYRIFADQLALQYPSQDAAQVAFQRNVDVWQSCEDKDIVATFPDDSPVQTGRIVDLTVGERLITTNLSYLEVRPGYSCQHALALAAVFIVDVRVCGAALKDQARVIATKVVDKIPDGASASPPVTRLPQLKPMLLDLSEITALTPLPMKVVTDGEGLNKSGLASDYSTVPWSGAYTFETTVVDGTSPRPLSISQNIVRTVTPTAAAQALRRAEIVWKRCLNTIFHRGADTTNTFIVADVQSRPDLLSAQSIQTNVTYSCRHVMAVKDAYIVETRSCGGPPVDVEKMMYQILAKVPG